MPLPQRAPEPPPITTPPPGWLPAPVAAEVLGITDRHVRRLCEAGDLAAVRVGHAWWVNPACRPALRIATGQDPVVAIRGDPLARLAAAKRRGIHERYALVLAWRAALEHKPAGRRRDDYLADWCEAWRLSHPAGRPFSPRSVYRWEAAVAAGGIAGLLDSRGGFRGPAAVDPAAWRMFAGLYLDENRPHVPRIYELVAAAAASGGWAWPSLRTIQRRCVDELDPKLRALGREPRTFRDRCEPTISRDWSLIPAMGCWVADHRQFDVLLPHKQIVREKDRRTGLTRRRVKWAWHRPWLTMFLDARSWMPAARRISFDAPDGNRVMETFVAGVIEHGKPDAAYLDNGKDFRMYRFAGGRMGPARKGERIVPESYTKPMLELIGVEARFALPYNARAKVIEPFFKIVAERFDKTWETYCGRRADLRPERLSRNHVGTGDRKAAWSAVDYHEKGLTLEAFQTAFDRWLNDDYAVRTSPATAAGGLTPAQAFVELRCPSFTATRPPLPTLALLLMPSAAVRVEAQGVYVPAFGQHYWDAALEDRRCGSGRDLKRKVRYRYFADDPSVIFVFDGQTDAYICAAGPAPGANMHPLAPPGSPDAERLAEAMGHQRRLGRRYAAELRDLRGAAGGKQSPPIAMGGHSPPVVGIVGDGGPAVIRLTGSIDAGAAAVAEHRERRQAPPGQRPPADRALAESTLTTDAAGGRPAAERPRTALDVLADAYDQETDDGDGLENGSGPAGGGDPPHPDTA